VSSREAERRRLDRLAGSGKGWGGGLPLPLLFEALFNELMDEGSATTTRLIEIARARLDFKEAQVMGVWPSWDKFTQDVLDQMASRDLIADAGGIWTLGPTFQPGEELTVIPAERYQGRTYPAHSVMVWPKAEREALSLASKAESEASSLVARPNPVKRDVVAKLRDSSARVGPQYPILTDANGRIIDGHHRDEADPSWPKKVATRRDGVTPIETDAEALALIAELDIRRPPMPEKTRKDIDRILGELATTNRIKRDRIEAELIHDASRSDRAIAELVGTGNQLVGDVRRDLCDSHKCHVYEFTTARTGKHSAACWCGEGEAKPKAQKATRAVKSDDPKLRQDVRSKLETGKPAVAKDIAADHGVSPDTAENAIRAEKARLEGIREGERRAAAAAARESEPTEPPPLQSEPDLVPSRHAGTCPNCGHVDTMEGFGF
jgi:hypothetical protein